MRDRTRSVLAASGLALAAVASILFFAHRSSGTRGESVKKSTQPLLAPAFKPVVRTEPIYGQAPRIVLGALIVELVKDFGKPAKKDGDSWDWELKDFGLMVRHDAQGHVVSYSVTMKPDGRPLLTPDGVILGKDTFAQAEAKVKGRLLPEKQDFGMEDGVWYLYVYARSATDPNTTSVYSSYLNDGIPEQAAIVATEKDPTPNIFARVQVDQYSVEATGDHP